MVIFIFALLIVALFAVFGYLKRTEEQTERLTVKKSFGIMSDYYLDVIEYVTTGYYDEAVTVLKELISKSPDDFPAYLIYSFILRRQGQVEKALNINKTLLATRALSERGRLAVLKSLLMDYHENGMFKTALKTIEDEGKKLNNDAFVLKLARDMAYGLHDYDTALQYNKRLLTVKKKRSKRELCYVASAMAREALRKDDILSAEKLLAQARSFNKDCERMYYTESLLYEKKNDIKRAREAVLNAIDSKPAFADRFQSTLMRLYASDYAKLIIDFKPILEKHLSEPRIHIVMSAVYYAKRQLNDALEELIEAILYEPKSRAILLLMLDLYIETEQWEKVKEIKDELKTLEDESAYVCTQCGTQYMKKSWHCTVCDAWGTTVSRL